MRYYTLILLINFLSLALSSPTPGCSVPASSVQASSLTRKEILVEDPLLGKTLREYYIYVPAKYSGQKIPAPLLIYLHGQYGNASDSANFTNFTQISEEKGFISVFPQGLGDGHSGTGWNTGMMGNGSASCDQSTKSCCYDSCRKLGFCSDDGEPSSKCQWATCYDDLKYINSLIELLGNELCLDKNAYFLVGESNGGMMTHWLSANNPTTFKAVAPIYATPLAGGYLIVPNQLKDVRFIALHDRNDTIIPSGGGNAEGWLFESEETTLRSWALVHQCDTEAGLRPLTTPFGQSDKNLSCSSYHSCNGRQEQDEYGRHTIVYCEYDGHHGDSFAGMYEMIWWFFEFDLQKAVAE